MGPMPNDVPSCTCHPDDNPPRPCPRKYALKDCRQAQMDAALAELMEAVKIFAFFGDVLSWKADPNVGLSTVVYEPSEGSRQPFRVAELGEVEWPEGPAKPDDWLFGIWYSDRRVAAASGTPVIQAKHFYAIAAALTKVKEAGK